METKAQKLAERLRTFNREVISFVQSVPDPSWQKKCAGEQWPINVVARHIGAAHYGAIELAKMMIAGTPIPDGFGERITQNNAVHAAKHADCSREEVLSILTAKGAKVVSYVSALRDADLETRADIPDFGGEITVKQMIEALILRSGGEHLESMRKTLAVN